MTDALKSNMHQSTARLDISDYYTPTEPINAFMGGGTSYDLVYTLPYNAASFLYEPTLRITEPGDLLIREDDKTNAIFGFEHILGEITNDTNNVNYNRLVLLTTGDYVDSVVLKKPWIQGEFRKLDDERTALKDLWNCQRNYLSINLRRLNVNIYENSDDTVLTIRIKYKLQNQDTGYIKFHKKPNINTVTPLTYNGDRGFAYPTQNSTADTNWCITKKMLPKLGRIIDGHTTNSDITMSALFICDGEPDPPYNHNYKLRPLHGKPAGDEIIELDIEVIYHGGADIAIDWVRLENPMAQNMFFGKYDTEYTTVDESQDQARSIKGTVQDKFIDFCDTTNTYKLFRIYGHGGDDGVIYHAWGTQRYLNNLLGGVVTTSIEASAHQEHFEHYFKGKERWIGGPRIHLHSCPYYQCAKVRNWDSQDPKDFFHETLDFNYHNGYRGHFDYSQETDMYDTLNSGWEIWTTSKNKFGIGHYLDYHVFETLPFETYDESLNSYEKQLRDFSGGFQIDWEAELYWAVFKSPGAIYGDTDWMGQVFSVSNWSHLSVVDDILDATAIDQLQPLTSEVLRLQSMSYILKGAKGLCYDRQGTFYDFPTTPQKKVRDFCGIGVTSHPDQSVYASSTLDTMVFSNKFGGDFIDLQNDLSNIHLYFDADSVAEYLGVKPERIYIGRKSMRTEMIKMHSWIRAVNDALMNLKMLGWYCEGLKLLESWHPNYTYNPLTDYIKTDSIRSKRIWNPITSTWYYNETIDSSFFDITILKEKDDLSSNKFYLGVQNRRVDPLLYFYDSTRSVSFMNFITGAEFDYFVQHGGDDPATGVTLSANGWSDHWWKREGCREFRIPFVPKTGVVDSSMYNYYWYTIRDLGNGNSELVTKDFWLEPFTDHIDTSFATRAELKLWFQPGEGKLLEIEALPIVAFDEVSGSLDFCDILKRDNHYFLSKCKINESETNCCYDLFLDGLSYHTIYGLPITLTIHKDDIDGYSPTEVKELNFDIPRRIFSEETTAQDSLKLTWTVTKYTGHQSKIHLGSICIDKNETVNFNLKMGGVGVAYDQNGYYGTLDECYKEINSVFTCEDALDTCCMSFEITATLLSNYSQKEFQDGDSVDCCKYRFKIKKNDSIPCPFDFDDILSLHFSSEFDSYQPNRTITIDDLGVTDSTDPIEGQIYIFDLCLPGIGIENYYVHPRPEFNLNIDINFYEGDSSFVSFCTKQIDLISCFDPAVDEPCDEPDIPILFEPVPMGKMSLGDECCYEVFLNFHPPNNHIGAIHMETTAPSIPGNPVMESLTIEGDPGLDSNQYQPIEIPPDSTIQTNFVFCMDAGVPEKIITIYYYDLNGNIIEECTYTDTLSCPQGEQMGGAGFMRKGENQINEDINLQLSAVPNPAENSLFIRCRYDQNIQNSIKLRIYNIIGDEVYSEVISSNKTIEIDVSKFHKGTYIINAVEVNSVNQNGNINRASKIIIVK